MVGTMKIVEDPHSFRLRDWNPGDLISIAHINEAEIPHVSLVTAEELRKLADQAFYFRVAESKTGEIAGFVLALNETASYASLNFQWFKARYPRFTYIDRIVVAALYQGLGVGRLFYEDLESIAKAVSPLLTCEVNLRPPNDASLRFHQKFGFRQAGVQDTEGGKKTVALLIKDL